MMPIRENYAPAARWKLDFSGALRDFAMARAVMSPQCLEKAAVLPSARRRELGVGISFLSSACADD